MVPRHNLAGEHDPKIHIRSSKLMATSEQKHRSIIIPRNRKHGSVIMVHKPYQHRKPAPFSCINRSNIGRFKGEELRTTPPRLWLGSVFSICPFINVVSFCETDETVVSVPQSFRYLLKLSVLMLPVRLQVSSVKSSTYSVCSPSSNNTNSGTCNSFCSHHRDPDLCVSSIPDTVQAHPG